MDVDGVVCVWRGCVGVRWVCVGVVDGVGEFEWDGDGDEWDDE